MTDSRSSSGTARAIKIIDEWTGEVLKRGFASSWHYGELLTALRTHALPSGEVDESPPLEVWNGDRKVTVYKKDVIRIWGVDMEAEMSSEQRDHQTVTDAFDWLYANGPASSPAPQAQPQSAPPFSRWAAVIESASLTIGPKGSEALNALAAEVRAGGAAQRSPSRDDVIHAIEGRMVSFQGYSSPMLASAIADAIAALSLPSTKLGGAAK